MPKKQTKKRDKKYVPKVPKLGTKAHAEIKFKEAIELLNRVVCVKLAPSDIHGVGVIAIRDIKKGEVIEIDAVPHVFDLPYKKFNKLNKEVRDILLGHFPQILGGSHFFYPVGKMSAYLNHSDKPNYDAKTYKALKDIKVGEEITEDYNLIPGAKKIFDFLKD